MDTLTYDTVARFGMTASLLLFIAMFIAVVAYVFLVSSRDKLDDAQRKALDLGPNQGKLGGRK